MTSQHVLATPPSKDAILNSLLEDVRAYNAHRPPHAGLRECDLYAEMPLLLNLPGAPLACRETPAEFEAVNAHFSARVHAFFDALRDLEDMSSKGSPDADGPGLIRRGDGLWAAVRIVNQSFDIYPDCLHRTFHTRRLSVRDPDGLPRLNRVTRLRVLSEPDFSSSEPDVDAAHMRPVCPRVPLELAARLPHLGELDCPWLWERFPVAFSSRALRGYARVWEGPWRDARADFGRGVRRVAPSLPSSLTKVRLWFWKPDPRGDDVDQAAPMPDLVNVGASSTSEFDGMDPVSLGLRILGSRLERLDVRALITPDLFRSGPGGDGARDASSSWPRMRHLKVEFHPCSPDGSWYFSGPRGEDPHAAGFAVTREEHYPPGREDVEETHALWSRDEDEYTGDGEPSDARRPDMFRTLPVAERINALLMAFASSLHRQRMPCLRDAELFTWLTWRPSEERAREYEGSDDAPPSDGDETVMFRWGVRYEAPRGGGGRGKVTWRVGEDWRPVDKVIRAFEDLVGGDEANTEWKAFEFVGKRKQDLEVFL
ncbi:hypothetical protein CTA2_5666 [Colletotrichum tanaceti]|uniref:Uncharacterized protein n=1 Tax=Colletotrichum tanaceti TaxID=1306861 RepID=A0A4U6X348_9PEZI|nr:hypothetical protein CTA2_5666 [Colletotrichum tanaceti]TKW49333.1 hypothetical protein CTA1_13321 [Colletotrichum tanaceti]